MTSATAELEAARGSGETTSTEESHPRYDDINTPVVVMVGAISAIVTVCSIFFVQGLYYQWQNRYIRERSYDFVNEPVRSIVESQKSLLAGDAEKGTKSIETSINEIVEQFSKPST